MSDNKLDNRNIQDAEGNNMSSKIKRRTVLKALTGIPVVGLLGVGVMKKVKYDSQKQQAVLKELGLDSIHLPTLEYGIVKPGRDIIRIGFIGFGNRGTQLARALGFIHPQEVETRTKQNTLQSWL